MTKPDCGGPLPEFFSPPWIKSGGTGAGGGQRAEGERERRIKSIPLARRPQSPFSEVKKAGTSAGPERWGG